MLSSGVRASSLVTVVRSHHEPGRSASASWSARTRAVVHGPGRSASAEPECKSRPRAVVHVVSVSARPKNRTRASSSSTTATTVPAWMKRLIPPGMAGIARDGRNRPVSRPVRDAASSVPVCVTVRGIPAVPGGTGTESITMLLRPRQSALPAPPTMPLASQ